MAAHYWEIHHLRRHVPWGNQLLHTSDTQLPYYSEWQNEKKARENLEKLVADLQKNIKELEKRLPIQPRSTFTVVDKVVAPRTPTKSRNAEYETDEEELAKETEWIRVKYNSKKHKRNNTPSPPTAAAVKTKIVRTKITPTPKKEQTPPPIMVENIISYENLYAQMLN